MKPIIMFCYARSGGTLLNKCLASLPNVIMLSEVNPIGGGWGINGSESYTTVKSQSLNWYNININSEDFLSATLELKEFCEKHSKILIIRDWSFVNFSSCQQNNFTPPYKLQTYELLKDQFEFIPFAFIRDSIDVWISRGQPPLNLFFNDYLRYIKYLIDLNINFFKYEDFCENPKKIISEICKLSGIEYSDDWNKYKKFLNVNGDTQLKKKSRNNFDSEIKLLPRKKISRKEIREINKCTNMIECNKLVNYPVFYNSRQIQSNNFLFF